MASHAPGISSRRQITGPPSMTVKTVKDRKLSNPRRGNNRIFNGAHKASTGSGEPADNESSAEVPHAGSCKIDVVKVQTHDMRTTYASLAKARAARKLAYDEKMMSIRHSMVNNRINQILTDEKQLIRNSYCDRYRSKPRRKSFLMLGLKRQKRGDLLVSSLNSNSETSILKKSSTDRDGYIHNTETDKPICNVSITNTNNKKGDLLQQAGDRKGSLSKLSANVTFMQKTGDLNVYKENVLGNLGIERLAKGSPTGELSSRSNIEDFEKKSNIEKYDTEHRAGNGEKENGVRVEKAINIENKIHKESRSKDLDARCYTIGPGTSFTSPLNHNLGTTDLGNLLKELETTLVLLQEGRSPNDTKVFYPFKDVPRIRRVNAHTVQSIGPDDAVNIKRKNLKKDCFKTTIRSQNFSKLQEKHNKIQPLPCSNQSKRIPDKNLQLNKQNIRIDSETISKDKSHGSKEELRKRTLLAKCNKNQHKEDTNDSSSAIYLPAMKGFSNDGETERAKTGCEKSNRDDEKELKKNNLGIEINPKENERVDEVENSNPDNNNEIISVRCNEHPKSKDGEQNDLEEAEEIICIKSSFYSIQTTSKELKGAYEVTYSNANDIRKKGKSENFEHGEITNVDLAQSSESDINTEKAAAQKRDEQRKISAALSRGGTTSGGMGSTSVPSLLSQPPLLQQQLQQQQLMSQPQQPSLPGVVPTTALTYSAEPIPVNGNTHMGNPQSINGDILGQTNYPAYPSDFHSTHTGKEMPDLRDKALYSQVSTQFFHHGVDGYTPRNEPESPTNRKRREGRDHTHWSPPPNLGSLLRESLDLGVVTAENGLLAGHTPTIKNSHELSKSGFIAGDKHGEEGLQLIVLDKTDDEDDDTIHSQIQNLDAGSYVPNRPRSDVFPEDKSAVERDLFKQEYSPTPQKARLGNNARKISRNGFIGLNNTTLGIPKAGAPQTLKGRQLTVHGDNFRSMQDSYLPSDSNRSRSVNDGIVGQVVAQESFETNYTEVPSMIRADAFSMDTDRTADLVDISTRHAQDHTQQTQDQGQNQYLQGHGHVPPFILNVTDFDSQQTTERSTQRFSEVANLPHQNGFQSSPSPHHQNSLPDQPSLMTPPSHIPTSSQRSHPPRKGQTKHPIGTSPSQQHPNPHPHPQPHPRVTPLPPSSTAPRPVFAISKVDYDRFTSVPAGISTVRENIGRGDMTSRRLKVPDDRTFVLHPDLGTMVPGPGYKFLVDRQFMKKRASRANVLTRAERLLNSRRRHLNDRSDSSDDTTRKAVDDDDDELTDMEGLRHKALRHVNRRQRKVYEDSASSDDVLHTIRYKPRGPLSVAARRARLTSFNARINKQKRLRAARRQDLEERDPKVGEETPRQESTGGYGEEDNPAESQKKEEKEEEQKEEERGRPTNPPPQPQRGGEPGGMGRPGRNPSPEKNYRGRRDPSPVKTYRAGGGRDASPGKPVRGVRDSSPGKPVRAGRGAGPGRGSLVNGNRPGGNRQEKILNKRNSFNSFNRTSLPHIAGNSQYQDANGGDGMDGGVQASSYKGKEVRTRLDYSVEDVSYPPRGQSDEEDLNSSESDALDSYTQPWLEEEERYEESNLQDISNGNRRRQQTNGGANPLTTKESYMGKRVWFFRNGDIHYRPKHVLINSRIYQSLEHLVISLSQIVETSTGVKFIFSWPEGKEVKSLSEFQNGKHYVCSSTRQLQRVDYGNSKEGHWKSGKIDRNENFLFQQNGKIQSPLRRPRVLTIISNMYRDSREKLILNTNSQMNFEDILMDIVNMVNIPNPPVRALYTERRPHQKVQSYSQLIRDFADHDNFLACGEELVPLEMASNGNSNRRPVGYGVADSVDGSSRPGGKRNTRSDMGQDRDLSPTRHSDFNAMRGQGQTKARRRKTDSVRVDINGKTREFFPPTTIDEDDDGTKPDKKLRLDWVYGFRGRDVKQNLVVLPASGELVYFVAAVVVIYDRKFSSQRHYLGHSEEVTCLAVHPNGRFVATGQSAGRTLDTGAHVRVWDGVSLSTYSVIGLGSLQVGVTCINFSERDAQGADGSDVSSGDLLMAIDDSDRHILTVWEWQTEKMVARTTTSTDPVVSGCFYPADESILVTYGREHVHFWRLFWDKGRRVMRDRLSGNFEDDVPKFVTSLCFSPTGDVITGDSTGAILVWSRDHSSVFSINEELSLQTRRAHKKSVSALCMLGDGTLLSGGGNEVKAWDSISNYCLVKERVLPESAGHVRSLVPMSAGGLDGSIFVSTTRNKVLEGSLQLKFKVIIQSHVEELWAVESHPLEQTFVSAGHDQTVVKWSAISHAPVWRVNVENPCTSISIDPKGRLIALGTTAGKVIILNSYNGIQLTTLLVGGAQVNVLSFSPDGRRLAVGTFDGVIQIHYLTEEGQRFFNPEVTTLKHNNMFIMHLDWSVDSKFIQACLGDYDVIFWDLTNVQRVKANRAMRDVKWATHNCPIGHSIIGPWQNLDRGDVINVVSRSQYRDLTLVGDSRGRARLYKWPCSQLKSAYHNTKVFSSNVTCATFTNDDSYVITSGGNDAALMQFSVLDPMNT